MTEIVKFVTSHDLFNLLQDTARTKLIIDVRTLPEYEDKCVRNALHVQFNKELITGESLLTTTCTKLAWDEQPIDCKLKETKDWNHRGLLFQFIIVYDSNGKGKSESVAKLLAEEKKVQSGKIWVLEGTGSTGKDLHSQVGLTHGMLPTLSCAPPKVEYHKYLLILAVNKIKAVEGNFPTAIVPGFLYLGSYDNAKSKDVFRNLGITHVLNMAGELEDAFPNEFIYKHYDINDTTNDNIAQLLEEALTFIDNVKKSGKVLVHCAMGISRSSTIVIAWLMKHHRWTYQQAKSSVLQQRSTIKPNEGFVKQLLEFERIVAGSK